MGAVNIPTWARHSFATVLILLLLAFSLILPVDVIRRVSQMPHEILNTAIIVGAAITLLITFTSLSFGRLLVHRSCMQDIPKRYVPITERDLPNTRIRGEIYHKLEHCKQLAHDFSTPETRVVHAGLEPPAHVDHCGDDMLPPLLDYQACVKIIADRFKFQGILLNKYMLEPKLGMTFAAQLRRTVSENDCVDRNQLEEFITLYETIRYSGHPVTRGKFIRFMELCLLLVDFSLLTHRVDTPPSGEPSSTTDSATNFNAHVLYSRTEESISQSSA
ncbi:AFR219Cp [Eremothecium gossypii ATCC 10895]|uniref:Defect at low temperature protein 1 n=1 Tax=Eremothecium gossypii (strain ATCC 10895 / CBS 109.51 / FGSC 9923 / NRRL Y-1056) TaxID=284811 RepID=DLT1_EREGS|nr:AFR219Cp [Eremothecium gossypii ATCC 10895]Q753V6.1 RecName: Full=Defect at low temperature protein 1 [Eremothecium gossypii ATCC 10895]AAS53590.1 AFR219Cp [Eremothecium gossypii ATCC 10895]